MTVEIDLKGFQSRGIRKLVAKDRITPEGDFKTIMDFIEQDAVRRCYEVIRLVGDKQELPFLDRD